MKILALYSPSAGPSSSSSRASKKLWGFHGAVIEALNLSVIPPAVSILAELFCRNGLRFHTSETSERFRDKLPSGARQNFVPAGLIRTDTVTSSCTKWRQWHSGILCILLHRTCGMKIRLLHEHTSARMEQYSAMLKNNMME